MNPTQRVFNNRYRVDGSLGTGGMANVYVGTDTLLRRRVAIKVLREQYASDDDFVRRFSYEAQSAAKLSHPNIVNVYDFGREDHSYYIVMELVDGSTLGDIMRDERVLPEPVAVDYAIQIASGLAYAHRQGLLHRDVKPANILVTKDDVVKLSDFGIARAVSEHTLGVTQPGMVMGSVAYISPEQAQGHELDERSDLYSVGVVLYQMLTGALPFTADTPVAVALKHVAEEPKPIDPAATGVTPAVASIVGRLLRKNPSDRFASATELASALREARERPNVRQPEAWEDGPTVRTAAVTPPPRRSAAPDRPADGAAADVVVHHEERRIDPRWIVFPLLLALAIVVGFFALRAPLFPTAKTIALRDFTGQSGSVALRDLANEGFKVNVTSEKSQAVEQGRVIREEPAPGTMLARGDTVTLVTSGGSPTVTVPNVKGYSADDAQSALRDAKLKVKTKLAFSDKVPEKQVIDVMPAVGSSIPENSVVTLTVSKGVQPIVVPRVVEMKLSDARALLGSKGLRLVVGQQTESDSVPADVILSQDPDPQATAQPNAAVTVVVSTGPATVEIPDVAGNDPDAAQATLQSAGFNVARAYTVDAANPTGKVSLQQPAAHAKAKKGSKVTIYVSVSGSVPDVTGMSADDAKRAIISQGYQIGNTAYSQDATLPDGRILQDGQVLRTEPEANSTAKPGETVNITVVRTGG